MSEYRRLNPAHDDRKTGSASLLSFVRILSGFTTPKSALGRPRRSLLLWLAMAVSSTGSVLALSNSIAYAACRLEPAALVPLRVIEGFPIVPATIGSAPVSMLLDTGAQGHLLLPEAVQALGLAPMPGVSAPVIGTGGVRRAPLVMLDGMRLGGAAVPPSATPVAPLPLVPAVRPMLAGLLGAPLLGAYDLDLDVQAGRLALYEAGRCGAAVPLLGPLMTVVPLAITPEREALLRVRVNGQTLTALLDTGSRATLLTEAAARRLGLRAPISANTARGVDGALLTVEHVRLAEIAVGEDVRRDVPASVAPLQLGRAEMLLGLDYLGLRRVWISYVTGVLAIALPGPAASAR